MKKFLTLWILAFIMLVGKDVQATEITSTDTQQKDANAIMQKSTEVMNAKAVIRMDEYMFLYGQRQKILSVAVDTNTKISYVNMFGMDFYVDDNNQLIYAYEPSEGKWYVSSTSASDSEESMTPATDDTKPVTAYTYKETISYQNVRCDVIETDAKSSTGTIYHVVYYVNESTYELLFAQLSDTTGVVEEIEYSFPESITLPQNIVKNSVLLPGSAITIKGIDYAAPEGKGRTVQVIGVQKATGKVTIPDKITFAGKDYKVTGIADNAFAKNKKVKTITLGKNIKTIGQKAFFKCKNLKQVTIRSTVLKKIGSKAFYGNAKTLKVQAPKSKKAKYRQLIEKSKTSSKLKM